MSAAQWFLSKAQKHSANVGFGAKFWLTKVRENEENI